MKRLFLIALIGLLSLVPLTADVSWVLGEDGETVTVTWTYTNPDASEVFLVGGFNSWDNSATPMEKTEDGVWTYSMDFNIADTIQYKFYADGEWVTDEAAPAFKDDGFGGKNSYLDLAALIAASAEAEGTEVAVKIPQLTPISFGTWTIIRNKNEFLTRDILTGEKSGFAYYSSSLYASSYWKLQGDILPGWNIYNEIQVAESEKYLYKSSNNADAPPAVSFKDGSQDFVDSVFHPADAWLGQSPVLGHFKLRITNPYIVFFTGYKWAKGTSHSFIFETSNADDEDAGAGFTELSLGENLSSIGDMLKLDVMVAPNKRKGTNGIYSWINVSYDDAYFLDLAYNSLTQEAELYDYGKNTTGMFSIGLGAAPIDGLSIKAAYLMSYAVVNESMQTVDKDSMAWGLDASYNSDVFGIGLFSTIAGPSVTTVLGDDGSLKAGNLFMELTPWVKISPVKLALKANATFSNDFSQIADNDKYVYYHPSVDVTLSDYVPVMETVSLYTSFNTDFIGSSNDFGFKFTDLGLKLAFNELASFIKGMDVYYGMNIAYGTYDASKKEYPSERMYNSLLIDASLPADFDVTTGFVVKSNLTDIEDKTMVPFGFVLGGSWKVPSSSMKYPVLFTNFQYNMHPYGADGKDEALNFNGDNPYRPDNVNTDGKAYLMLGIRWDF